jgi:hypothetical protein
MYNFFKVKPVVECCWTFCSLHLDHWWRADWNNYLEPPHRGGWPAWPIGDVPSRMVSAGRDDVESGCRGSARPRTLPPGNSHKRKGGLCVGLRLSSALRICDSMTTVRRMEKRRPCEAGIHIVMIIAYTHICSQMHSFRVYITSRFRAAFTAGANLWFKTCSHCRYLTTQSEIACPCISIGHIKKVTNIKVVFVDLKSDR